MGDRPTRVEGDVAPPFDFWGYVDEIPSADLAGHDFSAGEVSHAWTTVENQWQHVLLRGSEPNVSLVIVLDLQRLAVVGHYLLDPTEHYGE